jgi:hypothetical protein
LGKTLAFKEGADMEDNREDTLIECPFYKWNASSSITCEGFVPGMNTQQNFSSPAAQVAWKKCFCRTLNYGSCIHAQALSRFKYKE